MKFKRIEQSVKALLFFYYVIGVPLLGMSSEPSTLFEGIENAIMLYGVSYPIARGIQQFLYRAVGM